MLSGTISVRNYILCGAEQQPEAAAVHGSLESCHHSEVTRSVPICDDPLHPACLPALLLECLLSVQVLGVGVSEGHQ